MEKTQKHLYQMTYWEAASGRWYTNDIKNLASTSAKWYAPMRVLNLKVEDYIKLLLSFHVIDLRYCDKTDYLAFCFKKEKDEKDFCSYINKAAKKKNFYCY